MAKDESDYTMPVEVAIQRELAYRRRVSMQQLQQDGEPDQYLLPLQVYHSTQNPTISGWKQQAPSSSLEWPPPHHRVPLHTTHTQMVQDKHLCKICQVPCSSAISFSQHIKGHKHRAQVAALRHGKGDAIQGSVVPNTRKRCRICEIWCMNEYSYKQHLDGQKHRSKLQKLEDSETGPGKLKQQRNYCKLCNIWCLNEDSLKMHLQGNSHLEKMKPVRRNRDLLPGSTW